MRRYYYVAGAGLLVIAGVAVVGFDDGAGPLRAESQLTSERGQAMSPHSRAQVGVGGGQAGHGHAEHNNVPVDDESTEHQSWEGKPKSALTESERQAIGATPIGYYTSRQYPRWSVIQTALERGGHYELAAKAGEVKRNLAAAARPWAKYDSRALIQQQASLLQQIVPLDLDLRLPGFDLDEVEAINEEFASSEAEAFERKVEDEE